MGKLVYLGKTALGDAFGASFLARVGSALAQLAEARRLADDAGQTHWDFAVEVACLPLKPNDLRWLACKGYLEHRYEISCCHFGRRAFRNAPRLVFNERSCCVLTSEGLTFAEQLAVGAYVADEERFDNPTPHTRDLTPLHPRWDVNRRELWLAGKLVKRFRTPSPSQEAVLAAFEEEGWPALIDDPLPPHSEGDSKRRLHHTIRNLNRNQKNPLLRFEGNGTGQRIAWAYAADTDPPKHPCISPTASPR